MAGQGSSAPDHPLTLAEARARWPDVDFVDEDVEASAELARFAHELLLTRACLRGEPAAQKHLLAMFTQAALRVKGARAADQVSGLAADLVQSLCVAAPWNTPALAHFRAAGALHAWLHVCAVRRALRIQSKQRSSSLEDHVWSNVLSPVLSPSAELERAAVVAMLRAQLSTALVALTDKQRDLLRMRLVDKQSIDSIGASFGAHRATAARWVDEVLSSLRGSLVAALNAQRGLDDPDLASICRLMTESMVATLANHLVSEVAS